MSPLLWLILSYVTAILDIPFYNYVKQDLVHSRNLKTVYETCLLCIICAHVHANVHVFGCGGGSHVPARAGLGVGWGVTQHLHTAHPAWLGQAVLLSTACLPVGAGMAGEWLLSSSAVSSL